MNRTIRTSFLAALLAGLAACSPSSPTASSSTMTAGPCGGLTAAQAASILRISTTDVAGPQHLSTFSCVYRSRKDFYTSMTFNVYVEPSVAQAKQKLEALKEGLADLSPIKAVDHLGEVGRRQHAQPGGGALAPLSPTIGVSASPEPLAPSSLDGLPMCRGRRVGSSAASGSSRTMGVPPSEVWRTVVASGI